ncbi:MAG TPA: hypothetical protein VFD57_06630 [Clostridia bacterium]|nr:hypothetical protein [Clostridia bacterium]HZJ83467.1 hypothetical protein [Clostridia bacterium]
MKEEIKKILKMIEEGQITADEGERLIEAMGTDNLGLSEYSAQTPHNNPRFLKVRVAEEGKNKVNVSIPISLVDVALKIGAKIGPKFVPEVEVLQEIDFDELMQAIREGVRGKLVDIDDGGNRVEVFVE